MAEFFEHISLTNESLLSLIDKRDGETKLGEQVALYNKENANWEKCTFHVLGVTEDIGPRLNKGLSGARNGFQAFLSRFVNVQSNDFLSGESICLHGVIQPSNPELEINSTQIVELDELLKQWTENILSKGGIPIVIGGGHNNALGLINGVSAHHKKAIAVVNLDPHADVRKTGERHSGNSFSTAFELGTMTKYHVLGLHQSYNNQFILEQLKKMNAKVSWFESWIDDSLQFAKDIESTKTELSEDLVGIELDMDAIAYMPSSAFTPSGITVEQARYYVRSLARLKNASYLHLPEAAPSTTGEVKSVGKTLAYLVTDFIKCRSNV